MNDRLVEWDNRLYRIYNSNDGQKEGCLEGEIKRSKMDNNNDEQAF